MNCFVIPAPVAGFYESTHPIGKQYDDSLVALGPWAALTLEAPSSGTYGFLVQCTVRTCLRLSSASSLVHFTGIYLALVCYVTQIQPGKD